MNQKQRVITAIVVIATALLTFLISVVVTINSSASSVSSFLDRFTSVNWESQTDDFTIRECHNSATDCTYVELEMYGETCVLDVR